MEKSRSTGLDGARLALISWSVVVQGSEPTRDLMLIFFAASAEP